MSNFMREAGGQTHQRHVLGRMRRVEGQVQAITRMLERGEYCVDVLIQIAAARAALRNVGLLLVGAHTRTCLAGAIQQSDDDTPIQELLGALDQFVR